MKQVAAVRVIAAIGLMLSFNACASKGTSAPAPLPAMTRTDQPIQEVNAPKWIAQKGAAFSGERRVFYGVGNAAAIANPALRRRSAEAASRRDIAQTFSVYITALNKQYMAATMAGMDKQSDEQHISDVMKQLTDSTLNGTSIVEYWEHPTRNEAYALARLDLEQFLEATKGFAEANGAYREMDAKMREFVIQHAEKAHDQLNEELDKRHDDHRQ